MTIKQFSDATAVTIRILKKKYTNLTAEEAHAMASEIVQGVVEIVESESKT